MIQILGLRPMWDTRKNLWENKEVFFDRKWRVESVQALFSNLDATLRKIPEGERWNLFYTVADCIEEPGRKMAQMHALCFDIDKVFEMDETKARIIAPIVCEAIGVAPHEVGVVLSGNGTHVIVGLNKPIEDPEYFDRHKGHYKALCTRIEKALHVKGFPEAKCDPAIFHKASIMRLPGTENRKPDKTVEKFPGPDEPTLLKRAQVKLIQGSILNQDFDLKARSGIQEVKPHDHIAPEALAKFPRPDAKAVLEGCEFLKWNKEKPAEVSEPEWYAALSILGNLYGAEPEKREKARALVHEYSKGHPGYNPQETDAKLTQAMDSSGPRTCVKINSLWGRCSTCKYHNTTLVSPITIRSEAYISSEENGFHHVSIKNGGGLSVGKPDYDGLRRFFERQNPYVVIEGTDIIYAWSGTHWIEIPEARLDSFAQKNFSPKADNRMAAEFRGMVYRNNHMSAEWFTESINRKVNFKNGVLDIDTMEFSAHSMDFGFRYVLPYAYDPKADCPRFTQFLKEITKDREELEKILMEFAGYALSNDDCWTAKALLLTGHGANGKSKFLEVLSALVGKGNYSSLTLSDLSKETNRYALEGKPFNVAEETPTNSLLDSSAFKNIVAGGEIMVKQLYKQPYTIRNKAKIITSCNELPASLDTSHGLFRRLLIIPFEAEFLPGTPGHDPFIVQKLVKELPGIFNLVIEGYKRLRSQGDFTHSSVAAATLLNYRDSLDIVYPWFHEHIMDERVVGNAAIEECATFTPSIDLFQHYANYAEQRKTKPIAYDSFTKKLKRIVFQGEKRDLRRSVKGNRVRGYVGIKFLDGKEDF